MAGTKAENRVIGMVAACPFPSSQGSQVLIRQLSGALSRRGHSVHVISYPFGDLPPDPGYQLHRASALFSSGKLDPGPSFMKPLLDLMLLVKVISVVRREKIDLLHGHNYEGILAAWATGKLLGIPTVYYCHSLLAEEFPTYFSIRSIKGVARFFGTIIDRITAYISDHTIAVSPEIVRKFVKTDEMGGKIMHITPGIAPSEWESFDPRETGRDEGLRLVYTGNLARFQNIPQLLEVMWIVRRDFLNVTLEVITPSSPEPLIDQTRSFGVDAIVSVIVENDFRVIVERLLGADIACSMRTMASGFPVKNLNYMAAGLPVVCYESGSKGVVDGETGIVVEDNDTATFARAVSKLLGDEDLRKSMGDKGREAAFRDYNWDDLAIKVEEVHESLLCT